MTKNEIELIKTIQSSDDPLHVIYTAIEVFTLFLKQHEADQLQTSAYRLESDEIVAA